MSEEPRATAAPQYAVGRLWAALHTAATADDAATRARAAGKVERWQAVLEGMTRGTLTVGSRTPVSGVPAWVTLEVVTGGFSTGRFLAEQPLDAEESQRLAALPPGPGATPRERLNLWYLSDAGQGELLAALAEERIRIALPEHAALPVVAVLIDRGRGEAALDLVATLRPWLSRLRFTPQLTDRPVPASTLVHLEPVGAVAEALRRATPRAELVAMRETLAMWHPLFDELVGLWAETVGGELPHLVSQDGAVTVEGGWPARQFPDGWPTRRAQWLEQYAQTLETATAPSRHRHPKSNFARLRQALESSGVAGEGLAGRDVGWVRRALANTVTRHGAPGSEPRAALRAVQAMVAARPLHADIAHVVAARLDRYPIDGGILSIDPLVADTTDGEATSVGGGELIPGSVAHKVSRALEAPVEELVERGVIGSPDVLARVLPQITAQHVSAGIVDPQVAALYAGTYAAFRRRRSLLLLNLEHQVRFEELPWIAALAEFRAPIDRTAVPVREALRKAVLLSLDAFPDKAFPNPLVREFGALATQAGLKLPLVEEVAADIFMGTFTTKWRSAAVMASEQLEGTLYARYYDLPEPEMWRSVPEPGWAARLQRRWGKATAEDFTALCRARAAEAGRTGHTWSVAANGAVLEQSQILTTHNLAVLTAGLEVVPVLRERAPGMVDRVVESVLRAQLQLPEQRHAALLAVKNTAYAWRQALFFLSFCGPVQHDAVLDRLVEATRTGPATRLRPAVAGLAHVLAGGRFAGDGTTTGGSGRRLLGWSVGPHWMLGEEPLV